VSTFTDGAPPSVSPDPGDDPVSANGQEPAPMSGEQDGWLQEEIRRRMAARAADGGGARHARRGAPSAFPGTGQVAGHRPRHATPPDSSVPGPTMGSQAPDSAPQRPLPSRARRFDAPRPGPPTNDPTTLPPASTPPSPSPRPPLGGPAVLHPAFGGQAPPDPPFGAPRRGPAFADPALLGDPPPRDPAPGTPAAPAAGAALTPVPNPPGTPGVPPVRRNRAPGQGGFVLPPSVAFRDGAAAGRAFAGIPGVASPSPAPSSAPSPAPSTGPSPTDETGPVPAVDPAAPAETGHPDAPNGVSKGPNGVGDLRRVDAPAAPSTPVGPGLPELAGNPVRAGRRPLPPARPAAARLLSPPPSPASTPTGIPVEPAPAETGPMPAGTEPTIAPAPGTGRQVAVPAQRGAPDAPVEPGTVTADLATSTDTRRYVDYEDYDDDYEDPELDAEIAEAARREAEAAAESAPETIKRVRVVLAERKSVARPVRTVDVVRDGTGVGEVLRRGLIRSQLMVALSFATAALLALGVLPLAFAYLPELTRASVLGIRLPWLLLGGLVYPFLLGLGWWHARAAERVEKGFADHVQG